MAYTQFQILSPGIQLFSVSVAEDQKPENYM
jgi:hypothetical protein